MKPLIFETPSLAPLPNRIGWAFFTAICWILWIYLWMPLITVLLWWLGFSVVDKHFLHLSLEEWANFKQVIIYYAVVVLVMGASLLVWAGIQFARFHNNHQRHQPLPVELAELAECAQISVQHINELSLSRRMIAHHDEHGKFLYAEIGEGQ